MKMNIIANIILIYLVYHRCVCKNLIINKCNNRKLAINYNFFCDILAKEISILDLSKNSILLEHPV